jgi:hypothetical protein
MGEDIDLSSFYLIMKGASGIQAIEAITDASVERTIEGASTLRVVLFDRDGSILRSNRLHSRNDVQIDGLWFRLVKVEKSGKMLTLTFEDREIAVLRTYSKPIKQSAATDRNKVTRAEFILRLIREVKEFKIPVHIPELHKDQPIERAAEEQAEVVAEIERGRGIAKDNPLTAKGAQINEGQRKIANEILSTGISVGAPPPVLVMAMMCAIQESTLRNLAMGKPGDYNYIDPFNPDGNPVGVFQQIKKWGWPATRNVATDAKEFFKRCTRLYNKTPKRPYAEIIEDVQNSGEGDKYAAHKLEAQAFVNFYGEGPEFVGYGDAGGTENADLVAALKAAGVGGDSGDKTYQFYRGEKGESDAYLPEDSWTCINRLAGEVGWRAFFVSGRFYYMREEQLFRSKPRAVINEDSPGIDAIDFDYDVGKKWAELTIDCRMGRWAAPIGSTVLIRGMGVVDGRWLVISAERGIFNAKGSIRLIKPRPALPEPGGGNLQADDATNVFVLQGDQADTPGAIDPSGGAKSIVDSALKIAQRAGGAGVFCVSDKRPPQRLPSGSLSDHSANDAVMAARDIAVKGIDALVGPPSPKLDKAVVAIGKKFGRDYSKSGGAEKIVDTFSWGAPRADPESGRFRVQIIWRTPEYGGHMGHIHLGVHREGGGDPS